MEHEEKEVIEMVYKKEGIARAILEKEGLSPKERKEEMKNKNLDFEKRSRKFNLFFFMAIILYCLPTFAFYTELNALAFFAELQAIEFPLPVIVVCIILLISIAYMDNCAYRLRRKKGGLEGTSHAEEWTLVFIREGPYRIIRHPTFFAIATYFILGTIILSFFGLRFTLCTVTGDILMILMINLSAKYADEPLGIIKWGDEYRQYMKEVPRFNFMVGLWRLRKRRK